MYCAAATISTLGKISTTLDKILFFREGFGCDNKQFASAKKKENYESLFFQEGLLVAQLRSGIEEQEENEKIWANLLVLLHKIFVFLRGLRPQ